MMRRAQRIAYRPGLLGLLLTCGLCLQSLTSASAETTFSEQEGHHGVNTFTNYHNASGEGSRIAPAQTVQVSCKVYDPYIASVNPDGYWYRIASSPWNDQYYAPANTFMNGDPWNGPYTHNTDFNVPDCGTVSGPPPQSPPAPTVTLAQGPAASAGYWYEITLDHFNGGSTISISCRDSVNPAGFRTFAIGVDQSGHAVTQSECRSADGPAHWVVANGVESNRVVWSGSASTVGSGSGGSGGAGSGTQAGGGPSKNPPSSPSERCSQPSGTPIPNSGRIAYALYNHYMWGGGSPVAIEWSYFADSASFATFARQLAVGQHKPYRDGLNTDMFYALGTFNVKRISQNCYSINDHYDFTPSTDLKKLPDTILTLPYWTYQLSGSREFYVYAAGRL